MKTCGTDCGCKTDGECQFSNVMTMGDYMETSIQHEGECLDCQSFERRIDTLNGKLQASKDDNEKMGREIRDLLECQGVQKATYERITEENDRLREALKEINRYSGVALGESIIGTMIRKMCLKAFSPETKTEQP